MKKIITLIVATLSIFSISSSTFAGSSIDTLLDLPNGVEAYEIQLDSNLDEYTFKNAARQKMYNDFVSVNNVLRDEIIKRYREGDFEYYQTQGIITNYKKFVYYTNQIFYYMSLKDAGISGEEIDNAIGKAYSNMRVHYVRMKNLIKQSY